MHNIYFLTFSNLPGQFLLNVRIVPFPSQQPFEPEESFLDVSHLAGLGGHTDGSLLLAKADIARRLAQGVVIGNSFNSSLPVQIKILMLKCVYVSNKFDCFPPVTIALVDSSN